MSGRVQRHRKTERGVSTVVGAALIVAIVVLLSVVTIMTVTSIGQSQLSKAEVQGVSQHSFDVEVAGEDTLSIRPQSVSSVGEETEFGLYINREKVTTWDGTEAVEIRCLYPGDHVLIRSEGAERSAVIQEHYFDRTTDCAGFNAFPDKFQHARVKLESESAYDEYEINDRYAFGLAIEPNGDSVAGDATGSKDMNLGPISLGNEWHYVKQYDREVAGLEPPVFVVVMVDNVHWENAPKASAHPEVDAGDYYNWTDSPPTGLDIGSGAFSVADGGSINPTPSGSEPTNDAYLVFKPGCDGSKFVFVDETAGYDNRIYLGGTEIISNTNTATKGTVFSAPGVKCRGDATWD